MRLATVCTALGLSIIFAFALTAPPALVRGEEKPAAPAPAKLTPEQEKAMAAAMEKLAAKGEPHKKLAALAGEFKVAAKCYMPGSDQPMTMEGTNKNELVLDGRWLRSDFAGTMMGQPVTGIGLMGFDNAKGKYVGTWVDSMTTQIAQLEGSADASGNVITLTSHTYCPINDKVVPFRYVYHLGDANSYRFEMYVPINGAEVKMMDIVYTRTK